MNGWIVVAGCAALAVTAIAAFFVARKISKAKQRKAVEDARQRMDAVVDNDLPHTAQRLRDGRF